MKLFKRAVQKGELRNVEVELVSLLFDGMKPANQKGFVVKNSEGHRFRSIGGVTKFKSETIGTQGRLYVTLMEPDVVDAQGDTYTKDEIQKACDHFSRKGMVGRNDINHNMQAVSDFFVAESYILKGEDKAHFPDARVGSWVQVLKCDNLQSELWQKVQKGEFSGVSIYGRADDTDAGAAIAGHIETLKSVIARLETSGGQDNSSAIKVIKQEIAELEAKGNDQQTTRQIETLTKALNDVADNLNRVISKSLPGEPDGKGVDHEVTIDGMKLVIKADKGEYYKSIANVDSGQAMNVLSPNTTSLFIDEVINSKATDTLSDITIAMLTKDNKIDAGIIDDLVLKNSADGSLTAQDVSTSEITVTVGILNGEVTLDRATVEFYKDKYGEAAFGAYVEQHLVKKIEKAIRMLLFQGDRGSSTPKLKGLDGVIAMAGDATQVTEIEYDATAGIIWPEVFEEALVSFDVDKLEEMEGFNIYVSHKDLIKLRRQISNRATNEGDRLLLQGGNVTFAGIPIKGRLMPDGYIVAGLTKFIIIGVRSDAEMKVEHHGSDWKWHWYIRLRAGITYVNGFVKVFQLAEAEAQG